MSWTVTIPGAPPSTNHMYVPIRGRWGGKTKAPGVAEYQTAVRLLVQNARPSGWMPTDQLPIRFDFFLKRDADCDNLLKALIDGIAVGLEIDDRRVLPCVRSKTYGKGVEPRTVVEIGE